MKNKLKKGDEVEFVSGNYEGLSGEISKVHYNAPDTPYGILFEVNLSDGSIGFIEKAEHWRFI